MEVIVAMISILMLIILKFSFINVLALDRLRNDLFICRDNLFALALTDKLNFKSDLYQDMELYINNTIRFAHNISISGVFLFNALNKMQFGKTKIQNTFLVQLDKKIDSIGNRELKKEIERIKLSVSINIVKYLLKTSSIFLLYFVFTSGYLLLKDLIKHQQANESIVAVKSYFSNEMVSIENQANCCTA